jgi:hypothetical protein
MHIYISLFTASTSIDISHVFPQILGGIPVEKASFWFQPVSQLQYTFVDNKIAGKWMMIPPTMALFVPHFSYKNII